MENKHRIPLGLNGFKVSNSSSSSLGLRSLRLGSFSHSSLTVAFSCMFPLIPLLPKRGPHKNQALGPNQKEKEHACRSGACRVQPSNCPRRPKPTNRRGSSTVALPSHEELQSLPPLLWCLHHLKQQLSVAAPEAKHWQNQLNKHVVHDGVACDKSLTKTLRSLDYLQKLAGPHIV